MANYNIPSPGRPDIERFRSMIGAHRDFSKAARFGVVINAVGSLSEDLMYLCDSAEHPGRMFNADEVRYYGPAFKTPTQSVYTDANFSFLVRDLMYEKQFFDEWVNYINPKSTYNFQYRDNYATTIDIYQFSEIGTDGTPDATYKSSLIKAYPVGVNSMPVNWAEDNINRLQITFAFLHWVTPPENEAVNSTDYATFRDDDSEISSTWNAIPPQIL